MLDQITSSSNYRVLDFLDQKLSPENFLKAEVNAYTYLPKYVYVIANSGLLFGKIKILQLRYGPGGVTNVYEVKDVGNASKNEQLCSRYGWGPILGMTQNMVDGGGIDYGDTLDCLPRNPNLPIEPKRCGDQFGL